MTQAREETTSATEPERPEDPPNVTAEEIFADKLQGLFGRFTRGQSTILRLSEQIALQEDELDDLKVKTREHIESHLDDEIDDAILSKLIEYVSQQEGGEEAHDPENDRIELQELDEILDGLPKGHAESYMNGLLNAVYTPPTGATLRASLLVSMVGELEIFANLVMRACFEYDPSKADTSESTFSWAQIVSYDTLEAFRESVIDRAVEGAFHDSLAGWLEVFEKKLGIKVHADCTAYAPTEVMLRRNCIVHNGGTASSLYYKKLKGVRNAPRELPEESLVVDSEYLNSAADSLYFIAMSLTWAAASKLMQAGDDRNRTISALTNSIYFLLPARRFDLAIFTCERIPKQHLRRPESLILDINRWLAYKLSNNFDKVRDEVTSFDPSALADRFIMAKHALLDEHEAAFHLAQLLLKDKRADFPHHHFITWPLLRGTRRWARENAPEAMSSIMRGGVLSAKQTQDGPPAAPPDETVTLTDESGFPGAPMLRSRHSEPEEGTAMSTPDL